VGNNYLNLSGLKNAWVTETDSCCDRSGGEVKKRVGFGILFGKLTAFKKLF
jgi:hypothetical protein